MTLAQLIERPPEEQDWHAQEHIEYLETILIPDLRESGSDATADDFEEMISHYRVLKERN